MGYEKYYDRYAPDWAHNPVGVYLMSCYAYVMLDSPFLEDWSFDTLGKYIEDTWAHIDHPHKKYIDPVGVSFTSSLTVPYEQLPPIIFWATHQKIGTDFRTSPIYNRAMREVLVREFI